MWEHFLEYLHRPFKGAAEMNVVDWFLFAGLIIVILVAWRIVFTHIQEAV